MYVSKNTILKLNLNEVNNIMFVVPSPKNLIFY